MTYTSKAFLAFTLLLFYFSEIHAQTYRFGYRDSSEITVESGTLYDNGGPDERYKKNSYDILVLRPGVEGKHVQLDFEEFSLNPNDVLEIYSGIGTSTLLVSAKYNPQTVYSMDDSGALTLLFRSAFNSSTIGFKASISLVDIADNDLEITGCSIPEDTIEAGGNLNSNLNIINNGNLVFPYPKLEYYISSDSILDDSDRLMGRTDMQSIDPGSIFVDYRVYGTVRLKSDISEGNYFLIARLADVHGKADYQPENSRFAIPVYVKRTTTDLALRDLSLSPNQINSGVYNSISFKIEKNSENTVYDAEVGFYLSSDTVLDPEDLMISKYEIPYIWNNEEQEIEHTIPPFQHILPDEGIYYLITRISSPVGFEESNEANNTLLKQVLVSNQEQPGDYNLTLKGIRFPYDTVASGVPMDYTFDIAYNPGISSALLSAYISQDSILNTDFDRRFYVSNLVFGQNSDTVIKYTTSFSPNETYSISLGLNYIIAVIDPDNMIHESNESDNVYKVPLHITEETFDEWVLSKFSTGIDSVLNTQYFPVSCEVLNQGSSILRSSSVGFYLSSDSIYDVSDSFISRAFGKNISPGNSDEISTNLYLPEFHGGDYYIIAVANDLSLSNELKITNNIMAVPLRLLNQSTVSGFDFQLTNLEISDTVMAYETTPMSFEYFFHHTDEQEINFCAYLSTDSIFDKEDLSHRIYEEKVRVPAYLETRTSSLIEFTYIKDPGQYYLILKADADNTLFGEEKTNNLIIKALYIKTGADSTIDLVLSAPLLTDCVYGQGSELNTSVVLFNKGTVAVDTAFIELYLKEHGATAYSRIAKRDMLYQIEPSEQTLRLNLPLSDTLEPGLYDLLLLVEPSGTLHDPTYGNNQLTASFGIQVTDVDFIMLQSNFQPEVVPERGEFQSDLVIKNSGSTATGSPAISWFLSGDAQFSTEDIKLATVYQPGLQFGEEVDISRILSLPESVDTGAYYLFAVIDPENNFAERSDTNNILMSPLKVSQAERNLVLEDINLTINRYYYARYLQIACTVTNTGDFESGNHSWHCYLSSDIYLDPSDQVLATKNYGSLEPGQQYTIEQSHNISRFDGSEAYYIICVVDEEDQVPETNESDNSAYEVFTPGILDTDLVFIDSEVPDSLTMYRKEGKSWQFTIGNVSAEPHIDEVHYTFYISGDTLLNPLEDTKVGSTSYDGRLAADQQYNIRASLIIPESIPYGDYYWIVSLDSENKVWETHEDNNDYITPLKVPEPEMDLSVTNLEIPGDTICKGDIIDVSYEFSNLGSVAIDRNSTYRMVLTRDTLVYFAKHYFRTANLAPLSPAESFQKTEQITFPETLPSGWYYLVMTVDYYNGVPEYNEENNVRFVPLYLKAREADLTLTEMSTNAVSLYTGYQLGVDCSIRNTGPSATLSTYSLGIFLSTDTIYDGSDPRMKAESIETLLPGETCEKYIKVIIPEVPEGDYHVLCVADYNNVLEEYNEDNNTRSVPLAVKVKTPMPDLGIRDVSFEISTTSLDIELSVKNQGDADILTQSYCAVYYSKSSYAESRDKLIEKIPVEPLSAGTGQLLTLHIPFDISGNYNGILIVVDSDDEVDEWDETNNWWLWGFPDISYDMEMLGISTDDVVARGDRFELEALLANRGPYSSDSLFIKYKLSADITLDNTDLLLLDTLVFPVNSDENTSLTHQLVLPGTILPGEYFLFAELRSVVPDNETDLQNNTTSIPLTITFGTGIDYSGISDQLSIFPNPASDILNIRSNKTIRRYRIADMSGKYVMQGELDSQAAWVYTGQLEPGQYFLILDQEHSNQIVIFEVVR